MATETIVTAALTGGHMNFQNHPNFPITPEQIAREAIEARAAGAAVAHIHVREPDGSRSGNPAYFREVVERIRDADCDILINLTTGEGARFIPSDDNPMMGNEESTLTTPEIRLRHVLELRPDICTLDCGTMNFGEAVFMNTPAHLRKMAAIIKDAGVKPEIEVFEPGHIRFAIDLIENGLIESPALFQLCLGIPWGSPATPQMLQVMESMLPRDANWAAFGISRSEFKIVAEAVNNGGHVRVGLEDNLYLEKGVFASNAQLVEKAVRIMRELDAEPVEPDRAAEILELLPRSQ